MIQKKYKVNEYITLKLERNNTNIYIGGIIFQQCKYLMFNIPLDSIEKYNDLQSIDEMEKNDRATKYMKLEIDPEQEFWGHCSNLQGWFESKYDTRLLHRNIAFPLLKKLSEIGDPLAMKSFKEEIIFRINEGFNSVVIYLVEEGYLEIFSNEEIEILSHSIKSSSGLLAIWGIQHDAPIFFFKHFNKLIENPELAKLAVQNNVRRGFYDSFELLKEDVDFAKWIIFNHANVDYLNLDVLKSKYLSNPI